MTRRRRSVPVLQALGLIVAAVATSWTLTTILPVTVASASALSDVGFGWPFPWYHQDLTRFAYIDFPVEATVVGDRVSPVPTRVDWLPFTADVALTALVLWPVAAVLIRGVAALALRAAPATGSREATDRRGGTPA
ncbi:hypothetical protein [Streptomyces sp. AC495_CC817]|uniref:hypothetical protein n=1 Tax=Streptomyces sp. AC495_CC817 TaxID=2823900 RepID=UPI001C272365|nr:hypothetical protein [Streptomyces sp. AC495_CC817]